MSDRTAAALERIAEALEARNRQDFMGGPNPPIPNQPSADSGSTGQSATPTVDNSQGIDWKTSEYGRGRSDGYQTAERWVIDWLNYHLESSVEWDADGDWIETSATMLKSLQTRAVDASAEFLRGYQSAVHARGPQRSTRGEGRAQKGLDG